MTRPHAPAPMPTVRQLFAAVSAVFRPDAATVPAPRATDAGAPRVTVQAPPEVYGSGDSRVTVRRLGPAGNPGGVGGPLATARAASDGAVVGPTRLSVGARSVDDALPLVLTLDADGARMGGGTAGGLAGTDPTYAGGDTGDGYRDPIRRLTARLPGRVATHSARLLSFELIRWAIPALHAAILKRRFLEGSVVIRSDDAGLARDLSAWWQSVPVGDTLGASGPRGGDAYLDALSENADEYGVGFGEMVVESGTVERLALPNPRTFEYAHDTDPVTGREGNQLFQNQGGRRVAITSPFVQTVQFMPSPLSPWGRALAWGLEPTAEILLRIYASVNDLWFRSGSPSEFFTIDPNESEYAGAPSGRDLQDALDEFAGLLGQVNDARARGYAANLFYAFGKGQIRRDTLGGNVLTQSLAPQFRAHLTAMAGQVIQNSDVPSFLFPAGLIAADGLNSDRARVEATLATAAAALRNGPRETVARGVIDTFLSLERSARFIGRYTVSHELPPLHDPATVEEARERRAKTTAAELLNVGGLMELGQIPEGDAAAVGAYLRRVGVLDGTSGSE